MSQAQFRSECAFKLAAVHVLHPGEWDQTKEMEAVGFELIVNDRSLIASQTFR